MSDTNSALPATISEVAKKLNSSVLSVIGAKNIEGFEKAYLVAAAAGVLQEALTTEYMKPIMKLQGNRLGFKTDKDREGGYPEAAVKNCLIEAVLMGLQPVGNQFNIIAGNTYATKEGMGYLLKNIQGLSWEIIPSVPSIQQQGATVSMKIKWTIHGKTSEKDIIFPVKVNSGMGADAVIGKATRKARAWLYSTVTNTEVSDGEADAIDIDYVAAEAKPIDKESERIELLISDCKTVEELEKHFDNVPDALMETYLKKKAELSGAKPPQAEMFEVPAFDPAVKYKKGDQFTYNGKVVTVKSDSQYPGA